MRSKILLVAMMLAALLAMFLLGRASVECGLPRDHIEWLETSRIPGPIVDSPEREAVLMSAAETYVERYVGQAMPVHYIEWRGWVFVVVRMKPIAVTPSSEYRILAYREVAGEWILLDEWRWFVDLAY